MNSPELLDSLREIIDAQLVVDASADQFAFRHALIREAIYNTLLLRERRKHHRTIAETLERLYGNECDQYLGDLAYHYYEAEVWERALEYSQRAGQRAQALYAPREAIEHFTRALQAARQLALAGATDRDLPRGDASLYRARAKAFGVLGEFERARSDYETALASSRAERDLPGEWQALLELGFLWASRDYARTNEYFDRALELARALGDPATLGHTLNRVGNWYLNAEQPRQALALHQEALDFFERLNDKPGLAETYDLLGISNYLAGNRSAAVHAYQRAIALFRELDDRQGLVSALATFAERGVVFYDDAFDNSIMSPSAILAEGQESLDLARSIGWRSGESFALVVLGALYASYGELGRAVELGHAALAIAQEIEHRQWTTLAYQVLGILHNALFDYARAQQWLEQALALAREANSLLFVRQCAAWLASAYISQGDAASLRRAGDVLRDALGSETRWETFGQRLCGLAQVELALARGEPAAALKRLDELEHSASREDDTVAPRALLLRAEAHLQLDELARAETVLYAARAAMPPGGAPPLLFKLHIALGKLYRLQRQRDRAVTEFAAARRIVEQMAATIPDRDLRSRFLEHALAQIASLAPASPRRAAKKGTRRLPH